MTTADIARRLGVSTEFVRGEIRDGRLRANATKRKTRWTYRITEQQFDLYYAEHWRRGTCHVEPIAS